jgi:hypothetical protein
MGKELLVILLTAGISLIIFLACREIVCWYFKINKRVELLEEQNELLKKVHDELEKKY